MDEILLLISKTYGLMGLFLAAPAVAAVILWRDNKSLRTDLMAARDAAAAKLEEANNKVVEAHKQRVLDAQAVTGKLSELVSEQVAAAVETTAALDRLNEVVSTLKMTGHLQVGRKGE